MPTEQDPTVAAPIPTKRVISNRLPDDVGGSVDDLVANTNQQSDLPVERVNLPSRGQLYPKGHPAASGHLMVRPITTDEEDILATERFWRQGVALDMVMQRCLVTPRVNTLDLLSGDRLTILYYLRTISYGPSYTFRARLRDGSFQEITTDVSKLEIKELKENAQEINLIQFEGHNYEFRLSRGKDEVEIAQEIAAAKAKNPKAPDVRTAASLIRQMVTFDGKDDREAIVRHVKSMIGGRAQRLRAELAKIGFGPRLRVTVVNDNTGLPEEVSVQVTETFFLEQRNEPGAVGDEETA